MIKNNVVFFGTPDFAVPALKALIHADNFDIQLVVTQPDKPIGRHHSKIVPTPIKQLAQKNNIQVYHGKIKEIKTIIEKLRPSLGILVAYGEIIPKWLIGLFPKGILNLHPSLLPKYRGSSPIQAPILNGDSKTGVTIMKLDHELDHGPIIAQQTIKLNQTENAGELHDKLSIIGAELFIKILPDYLNDKIIPKEQDHSKASFTQKLSKKDGHITNNLMATSRLPLVRAMNPWPGAWTMYKNKRLIIWKMNKNGTPEEVQLEGKKKMPYSEFLKGHPDFSINDSF